MASILRLREVVDLEALDDLVARRRDAHRERGDEPSVDAVLSRPSGTAIERSAVGARTQSCMWSIAALAADAAEDAPRASMIAAPRLPTLREVLVLVPGHVDQVDGRADP